MYVGERHTVTSTVETVRDYYCGHCGFSSKALVIGVGQGSGASPYFLDKEGAQERARDGAASSAEENVRLTLSLKCCPECGQREPGAAAKFWTQAILVSIGSMLAMWVLGWFIGAIGRRSMEDVAFWIFGPLGLAIGPLIYYFVYHWRWSTADQRVAFVPDERPNESEG